MWKPGLIAALLCCIACLLFVDSGHAQISLSYRQAPLAKVLADIERQTPFTFFHKEGLLQKANKVTLRLQNASLEETLDLLFRNQPFVYKIEETNISILPRPAEKPAAAVPLVISVEGRVVNELDLPVAGATVNLQHGLRQVATDANGAFLLEGVLPGDSLLVTSVAYETQRLTVDSKPFLLVRLRQKISELSDVSVVSSGYQVKSKRYATGSYQVIGKELFERAVSTNFIDRLEGIASSLVRNRNITSGVNQTEISIRGRSTIFANAEPLIVLDNFPYSGPLSSINPNDIDSITILKDAASSAIWGAYAGNGVIVITTRKGGYKTPFSVSVNTSITVGNKPDLYYLPFISSKDQIDLDTLLFNAGIFTARENNINKPMLSPVVEILIKRRNRQISAADSAAELDRLKTMDVRREMEKYLFRNSVNQQYGINLRGGTEWNYYSFTGGYDNNLSPVRGENGFRRWTFNGSNTLLMLKRKLELTTGLQYTGSETRSNSNFLVPYFPYQQLKDEDGKASAMPYQYRQPYIDTVGGKTLLDWHYRPLDEVDLDYLTLRTNDYRINIALNYKILPGFTADLKYQYGKTDRNTRKNNSLESYFTRDLINKYTQVSGSGELTHPVPVGSILDSEKEKLTAKSYRVQLNYRRQWKKDGILALAGVELRNIEGDSYGERKYGYDAVTGTSQPVDYATSFSMYINPGSAARIPNPYPVPYRGTTANYISWFMNVDYFWRHFIFSASARKEESNIFGVETNKKGVPLWSAGAAWILSDEKFYGLKEWLPYLKLRVSEGYSGNVDRNTFAFTTARLDGQNFYGAPSASINNPPNSELRWEKVNMINFGIDFGTRNRRVSGSLEYYIRQAKDLIGQSPIDPTTGTSLFRGNTGVMKGHGADIVINSININGPLKWKTGILFSYNYDEVATYEEQQASIAYYYNSSLLNPLPDKPLYSIYSLRWGGLDPLTGDPQGYKDGVRSKDYTVIIGSSNLNDLVYNGPVNPVYFGSVLNSFSWNNIELSFNIVWKASYYFRRSSVNYSSYLLTNTDLHQDITKRWRSSGDELITSVPSLKTSVDLNRDEFYAYSEALVEKGDHIRLQDISLSYTLNRQKPGKLPVRSVRFYTYLNNIGLLWRANDEGIDPDFIQTYPDPLTVSVGMRIEL